MTALQTTATALPSPEVVERLLIHGDLSNLSPAQKTDYYLRVCESLGLNPLTRPFEYMKLQGKEILYAKRDCTDQLRRKHNISITLGESKVVDGVFIIRAHASMPNGRTDEATGAVSIQGLRGEALANAIMKAETKAKRRATLSICGLGFLDETEVETVPNAKIIPEVTAPKVTEARIVSPPAPVILRPEQELPEEAVGVEPEQQSDEHPNCPHCGRPFSESKFPDRVTGIRGWYCFPCKKGQPRNK